MAEKSSQSPSPGLNGQGDEKPRLTEEEKKQNHIASEQKRRQAIRDGFDRLCELVPGLEGQGRSEGLVLKRTVEFMREQLERRRQLVLEKEARGEYVDDKMREPVAILERLEQRDRIRAAERGNNEEEDDHDETVGFTRSSS
ncbi:uncharacterized protein PG986_003481 [Apiospora aurea]|uniref:BHLH domain-containing protein n=1 Tax=Apiospora aurea TaxID=335848 RepID=A0ABR1QRU7_9PEZI